MESTKSFLIGVFEDEENMMHAAGVLRDHKIPIDDIYTPFPVHGLDDYLDIKRTRLPIVTFICGGIGLLFAIYFQIWSSSASWPLNVGGKPFNSFVAFIPVAFELMVLFGALLTVAAFFYKGKLYPGKEADLLDIRTTDDCFVICVECSSAAIDSSFVRNTFQSHGAQEIKAKGVIQ